VQDCRPRAIVSGEFLEIFNKAIKYVLSDLNDLKDLNNQDLKGSTLDTLIQRFEEIQDSTSKNFDSLPELIDRSCDTGD
jgi:hypothetical protein